MKLRHKGGKLKGSKASNVSLMLRKTQYQYKNMNSSLSTSRLFWSNQVEHLARNN